MPLSLTSVVGAMVESRKSWAGSTAPGSLGPQPPTATPTPTPVPHLPSADRSHPCHLSSPNTAQCLAPVSYPDGDLWQRVAGLLRSSAILAPWHHVVFWLAPLFRGDHSSHPLNSPPKDSWWRVLMGSPPKTEGLYASA